jgi:hypothetical protein
MNFFNVPLFLPVSVPMGLLAIDFLFMESVFCEQLLLKSGFIDNSIITLQILSLYVGITDT